MIARLLIVFLFTGASLHAQTYTRLLQKFEHWKTQQYKLGNFATEKNCNPDSAAKHGFKGPEMGIPQDITIAYTDINGDNKLDALVLFQPDQCDGGNALMNAQIRVMILSKNSDYVTDDHFIDKISNGLKKGWLMVEGAWGETIHGTYYEYKSSDGRCCPSIRKRFEIDYKTKKFSFTE